MYGCQAPTDDTKRHGVNENDLCPPIETIWFSSPNILFTEEAKNRYRRSDGGRIGLSAKQMVISQQTDGYSVIKELS